MRRSEQRRDAVFALYQQKVTGRSLDELLADTTAPFTRALARETASHIEELDAEIGSLAKGWTIDRIAPLELCIMRVALYEMHHAETPVEVAIDEAVDLAGEFCGADAPDFVNGILGSAARRIGTAGGSAA